MIDLDSKEAYAVDPDGFLGVVEDFASQLHEGWKLGTEAADLPAGEFESVVVLGMGGSGISGDFLHIALAQRIVTKTVKGYELPEWIGPKTLVFAVSYSGNTEETLETYAKAQQRAGKVIAVTTGGSLRDAAEADGSPVVLVPGGLQPRAALGYLTAPLLAICEKLGLGSFERQVDSTISLIERRSREWGREVPLSANSPKQFAQDLIGKIPIIYGSEGVAALAAYRWKCQLNECAKIPAYNVSFPELNHNEIVGWKQLQSLTADYLSLVTLRHGGEHPRNAKRFEVTVPLISEHFNGVHEVRASGQSDLERLFDLSYFGDFVSTYLAIAQGVDPSPVVVIQSLKKQLSE